MAEVTGLRSDALPYPVYAAPFGVVFPILDNTGAFVTGAAGLDSEVSKNGDTFGDCTNEATEIGSTGLYYLLLTAAEMTADVVAVQVKTSTTDAKSTPIVLYPRKLVTLRSGTAAGGAAGSITLDGSASALDDFYNGCLVIGTLDSNVEARVISDYVGSTKVASVVPDWVTTPDSDDTFIIKIPEGLQVNQANVTAFGGSNGTFASGRPEVNTSHIAGTSQTGADVGSLVAKFTGITSLAQWLGLIAGKQSGNSTARTEVRATGAGSGTYDETTDSLEAGRDNVGTAGAGLSNIGTIATVTTLTNAPSDSSGITTLLARLTSTRAGYLDNLSAGAVATAAKLLSYFQSALRKDVTVDADIGGNYDDATDSQEAIRDNMGTAQTGDSYARIGANGASLSAVPWNAAWDAEVQSEVQDAIEVNHLDHLLAATYDPASKPGAADALLNELVENDGGVARYTANALEQAPTGGSAPTVGQIADAVWEEALADHEGTAGSVAEALADAGGSGASAADIADAVWDEATSGHTTSGTFGEQLKTDVDAILADTNELQTDWVNGGRLDNILDARASQTSVDDLPTNAELATSQASADDATLAAIAALNNVSTAQVQTAAAAALTAYDPPTRAEATSDKAEILTAVGDVPTNAELTAALAAADDAVLAAIAALNNLSAAQVLTQVNSALTTAVADSVPADGSRPSIAQAAYGIHQFLFERTVSGTTLTVRKVDGATTLMTFLLGDATSPTSITRSA